MYYYQFFSEILLEPKTKKYLLIFNKIPRHCFISDTFTDSIWKIIR